LIDLLVSPVLFHGQPALQMVWIDSSRRLTAEDQLQQDLRRLQILHDLDHALLSVQDESETAAVALRHIAHLVPGYLSSSLYLLDGLSGTADLLACDGPALDLSPRDETLSTAGYSALSQGLPYVIPDLAAIPDPSPLQRRLHAAGVRASLSVPLRWDGALKGALDLSSASPGVFSAEVVQIAQEIANLLAVAIQQSHLKAAERQRRREAEVMRDVMASLASAGNLNQTLEAILVNVHNLIHYDRLSLYLVDENERFFVAQQDIRSQQSAGRFFQEHDPLVDQLRQSTSPLIIADIQGDPRFAAWPDLEAVRAWLGAPLRAGGEMIGFLSLGSLLASSFNQEDAERLQVFADQVAQVIERAWLAEQTQRRSEELEVLSSVTLALGRAETGENTLSTVLKQIAGFIGAQDGVFLFPDRLETALVVKASLDDSVLGLSFPARWDALWGVYVNGAASQIQDFTALSGDPASVSHQQLFPRAQSAILVPVKTGNSAFGVLGFGFDSQHRVFADTVHLCNAVAEIAATSLHRAVLLESLEKQVDLRTQHLSTLYDINAVAGEPLELDAVLDQVLRITLESLTGQAGMIHFLHENGKAFHLAVQIGLGAELASSLQVLPAKSSFWQRLANSTSPVVINDTAAEPSLPAEFAALRRHSVPAGASQPPDLDANGLIAQESNAYSLKAFIGAPIRAKSQVLGLLSLFDRSILDYTIEDITLFMTIADQIGGLVERARLVRQAESAAVVQERQRLARELHDSVTQLLYSQVLFAGAGLKVLRHGDLANTEDYLSRIDQAAQQALKEMRLLVYQLRPTDYLEEGLEGALARRLDSVEKRTGINARLVVEGDLSLDESVEMALYRIAEEALNNTLKHAQASAVTITLRALEGRVILEVADNGIGFDPQRGLQAGGMGLENMHERAAALGGRLQIDSQPGQGAKITVEIEV
jgi:signal transduction histidine kinase/putative methionine-R-sulfoxide reductase with GAF domain